MLHFIHKNVPRVFLVKSDSSICWYMNIIKWLACHMARRRQWKVAAIMTSLSWHHHHDVNFCLHQDGRFTKTIGKNRPDFAINLHIFWFDFSKAVNLNCIRNDIVLHVYFNPKCNEIWRKAAFHASSDSVKPVVSYAPCVCEWCQTSEFCTGHFTR